VSHLSTAYKLGAIYALEQFKLAATGIPPQAPPATPMPAPSPSPQPLTPPPGTSQDQPVKAAHDFFGAFLGRGDDNPTEAPRKTAAEIAVEAALEKLSEPRGHSVKPGSRKGGASQPTSRAPAGKGTRFKALKSKLSRKKGVKNPGALAAAIGRSKFGKGKFQHMAAGK
jgi:hypothetical protein